MGSVIFFCVCVLLCLACFFEAIQWKVSKSRVERGVEKNIRHKRVWGFRLIFGGGVLFENKSE
jgi:hypothetical protein